MSNMAWAQKQRRESNEEALYWRGQVNQLHIAIDTMIALIEEEKLASAITVGQTVLGRLGND